MLVASPLNILRLFVVNRTLILFGLAEHPFLSFPCNEGWPPDIALMTHVVGVHWMVPTEYGFAAIGPTLHPQCAFFRFLLDGGGRGAI